MRGSAAFRTSVTPGGALAGPWVRNPLWNAARAVPSLDLRFADNKSLVDATTGQNLVTFTRASSGTYVDSQGVIRTATTNLITTSEALANVTGASITNNTTTAPDGLTTADTLTEDTSTGAHSVNTASITWVGNTVYTFTIFLKANTRNRVNLAFGTSSNWVNGQRSAVFDLSTGTVASSASSPVVASIEAYPNGWYRCRLTATTVASPVPSTTQIQMYVSGSSSYTGDGTSGLFFWGAQLETSSSPGEYIPTSGTINSAPRFDHNPTTGESLGLLVEEQRTNNVLQSEDFATTWTLNSINVSSNSVVAPDGTTTADTIAPPTDGLTATRFLRQNPVLTTQQAYTLSVFVKVGTATTNGIALYVSDSTATNNFRSNFNLFNLTASAAGTGWATPTATIIPYPNGWYRCILSGVTSTAHAGLRAQIYLSAFGTVADTYGSIHIWGAQLEAGAFPTSYIPTTTATVTRSADVASITGSNFSSWYRQDEGTVFSEFSAATYSTASFAISDGTNNNRIMIDRGSTGTRYVITNAGVAQSGGAQRSYTLNSFVKTSLGYALDNCNLAAGGVLQTLDTSATIPSTVDRLLLGVNAVGAGYGNGSIKRFTFWPQRLSDSTLQGITQL